jgi:hypothetical protein
MATLRICGVNPTVCGSQPLHSYEEAVVLKTPPCTDAVENKVHIFVLRICLSIGSILPHIVGLTIVSNVTNFGGKNYVERDWKIAGTIVCVRTLLGLCAAARISLLSTIAQ